MLDREERVYLRTHGKLSVLVVANERPYAYLDENGELAGAMKVVTDRLASDLGIEIEPLTYTDYESAYQAMQDGKADFLLNMFVDPEWGEERGLVQTAPFMVSGFTAVTRRNGMPRDPVIATLDNRLAKEILRHHFPEREIQAYPSIEACLEAVRQKKADVTSSVASVKAKDFNTGSVLDAGQLVQGKVAGLNISLPLKYGTLDWDNKIDVAGDQTPVKLGGLYDEWGWEFACEAQRRTQMIRFGTFTTKNWFNHTAITDGHTAIFPIPLSAMETNGNLKQNPGYESNR